MPAVTERAQPADAPAVTAPPVPVVSTTPLSPDPRGQCLKTLYESPALAERLEVARHIAARGDESAFLDLATFIAAAEASGDNAHMDVARQVAGILAQMHGVEIQSAATELAYSPSALVAEAAVNAAVVTETGSTPQWVDSGSILNSSDQGALDAFLQQLADQDWKEMAPLPEK